jgi:hypothetical protein
LHPDPLSTEDESPLPDVALTMETLQAMDRNAEVETLLRQHLPAFIKTYGPDHREVLKLQTTLMDALKAQEK